MLLEDEKLAIDESRRIVEQCLPHTRKGKHCHKADYEDDTFLIVN